MANSVDYDMDNLESTVLLYFYVSFIGIYNYQTIA